MSYQIVDEIIGQTLFESPDKWVLISLARHADNDDRVSWPSVKTMAQQAGVSERTVQRALRNYESLGVITDVTTYSEDPLHERKRATKYGGSRRTCCYRINDLESKELLDKLLAKRSKKREKSRQAR